MSRALLWLTALFFVGAIPGQQSGFAGPIQGFIFDSPTRSIRALTGSLGAASFGPTLIGGVDFATIAPRRNYGIAFRKGQMLFVSGLGSSIPSTELLQIGSSMPDHAAWSDDGSVAILGSQSSNWIQIYTGFPGPVSVGTRLPISGSLSAIASDAHGQRVVFGITGDQAGVYQVGANQSFSQLLQTSAPISLTFSADGGRLYVLDQATNHIFDVTSSNSAIQTWPAGVDDAIAIGTAIDGGGENVLYVAGRSSRLLFSLDQASHQTIASVSLSFAPTIIAPLGANGFLLTQRSAPGDILWTFTNSQQPAIYFVPAIPIQRPGREVPHP